MKTKLLTVLFILILAATSSLEWRASASSELPQAVIELDEVGLVCLAETPIVFSTPLVSLESQAFACQWTSNCGPIGLDCGYLWEGDCCVPHCPWAKGCEGAAPFCL